MGGTFDLGECLLEVAGDVDHLRETKRREGSRREREDARAKTTEARLHPRRALADVIVETSEGAIDLAERTRGEVLRGQDDPQPERAAERPRSAPRLANRLGLVLALLADAREQEVTIRQREVERLRPGD